MNIEIILIVMFAAFLVFAVLIFIAFMAFKSALNDAIYYMKNYTELITNLYKKSHKYEESLSEDILRYAGKCDEQNKLYNQFLEAGQHICEHYKEISDGRAALFECWKDVSDRYDQTYEQFKLCINKLADLHLKIEDLSCLTTEDEYKLTLQEACDTVCLDCPQSDCMRETCPVYMIIQHNYEVLAKQCRERKEYKLKDTHEEEDRICTLNSHRKCPYKQCARMDCPVYVEESVKDPTLADPMRLIKDDAS